MHENENSPPSTENSDNLGSAEYWLIAGGVLVVGMLTFTGIYLSKLPGF